MYSRSRLSSGRRPVSLDLSSDTPGFSDFSYAQIADQLEGQKVIVDTTARTVEIGQIIAKYYNPESGDIKLSPFDKRNIAWASWAAYDETCFFERSSSRLSSGRRPVSLDGRLIPEGFQISHALKMPTRQPAGQKYCFIHRLYAISYNS